MIERLESRLLLSTHPRPAYPTSYGPPPSAVAGTNAIVQASDSNVRLTAAANLSPSDQPLLDIIERNEGSVLYVYPDPDGIPTIGFGLNLREKGIAAPALASIGPLLRNPLKVDNYTAVTTSWDKTVALWKSTGHKDASPKALNDRPHSQWWPFIYSHKEVTAELISLPQETTLLVATLRPFITGAATFFGDQFSKLDRDPQIALVDLAYNIGLPKLQPYGNLKKSIQGDRSNATNYSVAAKELSIKQERIDAGAAARLARDRILMKHGEVPSSIVIAPTTISMQIGGIAQLKATPAGAKGKPIILGPSVKFAWSTSPAKIASVTQKGAVEAQSNGTATIGVTSVALAINGFASVFVGTMQLPVSPPAQTPTPPPPRAPIIAIGVVDTSGPMDLILSGGGAIFMNQVTGISAALPGKMGMVAIPFNSFDGFAVYADNGYGAARTDVVFRIDGTLVAEQPGILRIFLVAPGGEWGIVEYNVLAGNPVF